MMIFARAAALWSLLLLVVMATRPRPARRRAAGSPETADLEPTSLETGDYFG